MRRLLQYSLERNRAIRLIFTGQDGKLSQITAVVTAMDEKNVSLHILRPPRNIEISMDSILSADYRKGDEGCE